jgi:hypothetical protein
MLDQSVCRWWSVELSVEYVGMKCLLVVVGKTPQIVSVFQLEHLLVLNLLNILLFLNKTKI